MHEMSITQSLLEIALAEAAKCNAKRITVINLKIGALTGVVEESVTMYLEFLAKDTPAEGARLVATAMPVTARCPSCEITFPVEDLIFVCPRCGGMAQAVTGRELFIESLEIE
jgi:hydrogenase nickel incorporation protein HypA/HybF